jgi:5-methylcytosine-specific restriction endonuclease McrA
MSREEFPESVKQNALTRQNNKCGSCGEDIESLRQIGQISHKYGEGARAHHMRHCQMGGTNEESNCVILCEACHYSVHNGGDYRNKASFLISSATDYDFFYKQE